MLDSSRLTSDGEVSFPDTVVDIGSSVVRNRTLSAVNEEESYTIIGDVPTVNRAVRQKQGAKKKEEARDDQQPASKLVEDGKSQVAAAGSDRSAAKRGQKGKLKKIKEKYKDQDDDERQLKMELLQVLLLYFL